MLISLKIMHRFFGGGGFVVFVFLLYRNSHRLRDATLMRACCLLPKQFQLILLRKRNLGIASALKDNISLSYSDIISADRKEHQMHLL